MCLSRSNWLNKKHLFSSHVIINLNSVLTASSVGKNHRISNYSTLLVFALCSDCISVETLYRKGCKYQFYCTCLATKTKRNAKKRTFTFCKMLGIRVHFISSTNCCYADISIVLHYSKYQFKAEWLVCWLVNLPLSCITPAEFGSKSVLNIYYSRTQKLLTENMFFFFLSCA